MGSILYVSEGNSALKEKNHWQNLDQEESKYADLKTRVLDKHVQNIAAEDLVRARELASIYRQQGKQEDAALIYRKLWVTQANLPSFTSDGRELAALYTDMGSYASAVESYQKLLQYDRAQLPASDPAITRDLNNLGQCYYTAGCGTTDNKTRRQYFIWAREQFALAAKTHDVKALSGKDKVDQSIIELNAALAKNGSGQFSICQKYGTISNDDLW